jgi:type II secretory pathway pseudopilin PulG
MRGKLENGQAMIEILVAIAVVVLVLVAVVSRVVESVANATFARNQLLATRFAQEGIEWTRSQRDRMGWTAFEDRLLADGDPVTYCVSDLSEDLTCLEDSSCVSLSKDPCSGTIAGTVFDREIEIDHSNSGNPDIGNYVDVTVTVSWQDRIGDHTSQLGTRLSRWTRQE